MPISLILLSACSLLRQEPVKPAEALNRLFVGNVRFVSGKSSQDRSDIKLRAELAKGQRPFAVIIGCADSRVAPEFVFDQNLGDLFVVRTAGNLVDEFAFASTEYAVQHLGARLIVVLGHERCGAVDAALEAFGGSAAPAEYKPAYGPGHIPALLAAIKPAVEATKGAKDRLEATTLENVKLMVKNLKETEGPLKAMSLRGEIQIVGAYYDLDSGAVTYPGISTTVGRLRS
ncbi:MAG TPA: carbonic anhydrase [Fimbriimonadaceae bacterium]|nr:carbonic anhydrase [Fimbriimonadaceae bacterium]HRJ97067.1 carbonic anhydrase [Fimbriimonadaceae bacterium]